LQPIRYHDKFITQLVSEEDSFAYLSQRIQPQFLGSYGRLYTYVLDYRSTYGGLPSVDQLCTEFDDFQPEYRPANLQFLIDKLIDAHKEQQFQKHVTDFYGEMAKTNISIAMDKLVVGVNKTNSLNSKDPTLSMKGQQALDFVTNSDKSSLVCKWGIPTLDRLTGGIYNSDFNILVARPKVGKTHFSRWLAAEWWRQGLTPLIITLENGRDVTLRSIYAYIGGMSQGIAFREPLPAEEAALTRVQAMIDKAPNDMYIIDTLPTPTADSIFQLVDRYKPDIIIIDQLTLLSAVEGKADWEKKMAISRALKNFAQNRKIPIFALTQAARAADGQAGGIATSSQVAYTDSYLQDADNLLGLGKDPDAIAQRYLKLIESRRCDGRPTLDMQWDLNASTIVENREVLLEISGIG
jgi:KaiC/GvpD/RAD55 family RecA-like ATPase